MALPSPFSICPSIKANEDHLQASTSFVGRILALGSSSSLLVVDRPGKTVQVETRAAWFIRRGKTLAFREIAAVTYGYQELHPLSPVLSAYDGIDCFVVGLKPWTGDEIKLFSFIGEGTFTNNTRLPDWYFGDDSFFDLVGNQEGESRLFVELLSKMIGVKVEPSTLVN